MKIAVRMGGAESYDWHAMAGNDETMTGEEKGRGSREATSFGQEVRLTLGLGVPLALGEVGWMSTYVVDALMIGRLHDSAMAISASSLGNSIFYAIAFFVVFLMNGLETLVAQAFGRDDSEECLRLLGQSMWFVVLGTPLTIGVTLGILAMLPHFGTPAGIYTETVRYVHPLLWSTAPLLCYMALRRFLQSCDSVLWVMVSLVTASGVNWLFDWMFLFGHWGFRPMGIAGSAWSTVVVRLFMFGLLLVGVARVIWKLRVRPSWRMLLPERRRLRRLLAIGGPSGFQVLTELGTSTFLSIVCARLGPVLLAAYQVALDLNALVYQVSAGLSYATAVRVGQSAGRNSLRQVTQATRASLMLGLGSMVVAGTVFAVWARHWASLYTNSEAVVNAAVPLFTLCAVMLVTDTLFVLLASAFTGIGNTRLPMMVSVFWNWGVGMPLAYFLAFHGGLALMGLWLGRVAGSVGMGLTLLWLWRREVRRAAAHPEVSLAETYGSEHAGTQAVLKAA